MSQAVEHFGRLEVVGKKAGLKTFKSVSMSNGDD